MTAPRTLGTPPPAVPLGAEGEACADCGAVLAADQRYCLNCGLRRAAARVDHRALLAPQGTAAPVSSGAAPPAAPPATGRALSPLGAAVAAGLLLLAVLVGAVLGSRGEDDAPAAVVGVAPGAAAPTAEPVAFSGDWSGGAGWTIRLQTFDKASTGPAQVEQAERAASAKGVADVGSLDSDAFPSLGAGQYVVYSGRFASRKQARAALAGVRAAFPDAAVVRVAAQAPAGNAGGGSGAAKDTSDAPAQKQLEELESSSPEEYQKKSRKLPDEVSTGGKQEPKDDKAPSGGEQGGTTIG